MAPDDPCKQNTGINFAARADGRKQDRAVKRAGAQALTKIFGEDAAVAYLISTMNGDGYTLESIPQVTERFKAEISHYAALKTKGQA